MSDSFEGTRLCVSGTMMLGDRNQVIRFIRQNGGIWTSSVTASTEVLVIHPNELLPPTRKVRAAQSFGIPIVSEQWLLKSVAAGHCVETDPYAVKPPTNLLTSVFQSPALSKPIELTTIIFKIGASIVADIMRVVGLILVCITLYRLPTFWHKSQTLGWREASSRQSILLLIDLMLLGFVALVTTPIAWIPLHCWSRFTLFPHMEWMQTVCQVYNQTIAMKVFIVFIWSRLFSVHPTTLTAVHRDAPLLSRPLLDLLLLYPVALSHLWFLLRVVLSVILCLSWSESFYAFWNVLLCQKDDQPPLIWLAAVKNAEKSRLYLLQTYVLLPLEKVVIATIELIVKIATPVLKFLFKPIQWIALRLVIPFCETLGSVVSKSFSAFTNFMENLAEGVSHSMALRYFAKLILFVENTILFCILIILAPWRALSWLFNADTRRNNTVFDLLDYAVIDLFAFIVVLLILITLYRIPDLYRAFKNRDASASFSETVISVVETELSFVTPQSYGQQRANRWAAVRERKRLQKLGLAPDVIGTKATRKTSSASPPRVARGKSPSRRTRR